MKKLDWHKRNLKFMQQQAFVDGRLPWSYLEVVDGDAPESYGLLRRKFSERASYLAVNHDPATIMKHSPAPEYSLICNDAFELGLRLSKIADDSDTLQSRGLQRPVGVFNFDLQDSVGYDSFWSDPGHSLFEIVRNTHDKTGQCLVILNLAISSWVVTKGLTVSEALEKNAESFLQLFRPLSLSLNLDALMGAGLNELEDKGYDKPLLSGSYEIYRQTSRSMPMATMRVAFRSGMAYCGLS